MKEKRCKRKLRTKFFVSLFVVFFVVVILFVYIELVVNPMVLRLAEAEVDSVATTVISDAIFDVVTKEGVGYSDLVNITYDSDGKITSIVSNMEKMNYLARELSTKSQIYLDNMGDLGVKVAIGAFTGMESLSTFGPKVNVRMTPIGSVITSFNSNFISAGINQTRHSIYVDVKTVISVILPTSSKKIDFLTSALLCENIIVGDVPTVYLQNTSS